MEIKEVQKLKTQVVTDILCDICGASCKVSEGICDNDLRIDHGEVHREFEYMHLKAIWGYRTKKDNEKWTAYVCEKCVDEKLVPLIKFKTQELDRITMIETHPDNHYEDIMRDPTKHH